MGLDITLTNCLIESNPIKKSFTECKHLAFIESSCFFSILKKYQTANEMIMTHFTDKGSINGFPNQHTIVQYTIRVLVTLFLLEVT